MALFMYNHKLDEVWSFPEYLSLTKNRGELASVMIHLGFEVNGMSYHEDNLILPKENSPPEWFNASFDRYATILLTKEKGLDTPFVRVRKEDIAQTPRPNNNNLESLVLV